MRLGVLILPEERWSTARDRWRAAEELGFHHAWTYDHLTWRRFRDKTWFGAVPTLAAAAETTSRLRLGTLVASPWKQKYGVLQVSAARTHEAVAEQTAPQVRAQLALDEARRYALSLSRACEVSLELVSNDRVERRLLGCAPYVLRRLRVQRRA